jgi:hypothetical protein
MFIDREQKEEDDIRKEDQSMVEKIRRLANE